jgi:hypothetical protein
VKSGFSIDEQNIDTKTTYLVTIGEQSVSLLREAMASAAACWTRVDLCFKPPFIISLHKGTGAFSSAIISEGERQLAISRQAALAMISLRGDCKTSRGTSERYVNTWGG